MKILTARDINGGILFVESYKSLKGITKAFCNGCGNELIFKEGKSINLDGTKRKNHFAHKNICDCNWTNESDLHKIIKHIIFDSKKLIVNDFYFNHDKRDGFNINIENAELELYGGKKECSFRPDICGTWNGDLIWIEAVVTHECEENKIKYILDNDITCIEVKIDTNEFKGLSKYELESLINRGFSVFETNVINIKGLKRVIIEEKKNNIRTQLKFIKECAYKKTYSIKKLHHNIENVTDKIELSSLNELEKIKSYKFLDKLFRHRIENYINYQINQNSLESAIRLDKVLSIIPYQDLIKKCTEYYQYKVHKNPPIVNVGIYKGVPISEVDILYVEFIEKTKLNIFSKEVLEYANALGKYGLKYR